MKKNEYPWIEIELRRKRRNIFIETEISMHGSKIRIRDRWNVARPTKEQKVTFNLKRISISKARSEIVEMMDSSTRSFNCETGYSMMRRKKSRFLTRRGNPPLFRSIFFPLRLALGRNFARLASDDWTSDSKPIVRSFRCRPTTIVSSHSDNGNNGERLASSCRERRLSPSFRIQIPASRASSCVEWFRRSVTSIHYVKRSR